MNHRCQSNQPDQSGSGPNPVGAGERLVRHIEIRRDPDPWEFRNPGEDPMEDAPWDLWLWSRGVGGDIKWSDCVGEFPTWDDAMEYLVKHTVGWMVNGTVVKPSDPDYPDDDVYWTDIQNAGDYDTLIKLPIAGKWEPILDLKAAKHPLWAPNTPSTPSIPNQPDTSGAQKESA